MPETVKKEVNPDKVIAGCLMLDMTNKIKNWDDVVKIIESNDVYNDDSNDYGIESEPHITVLFGFDRSVTPSQVKSHFSDVNKNINLELIGISIFPGGDRNPFDVVKFDVESEELQNLNKKSKELPNKTTYPVYHPHMTIAYVKKGEGEKYIRKFDKPMKMDGNSFMFSTGGKHSEKTKWKIGETKKTLNENIENFKNTLYGFEAELEEEYPAQLTLTSRGGTNFTLSKIVVDKDTRGQGIGSQIMSKIIDFADANQSIISLTPAADFGGNKAKLTQFYKQFGFVSNSGTKKNYEFMDTMLRYPR